MSATMPASFLRRHDFSGVVRSSRTNTARLSRANLGALLGREHKGEMLLPGPRAT